jgi:hypothetical protein
MPISPSDNLLLETLMQIEKEPLQSQSNNQFIHHENVMSNNTPSNKERKQILF